MQIYNPIDGESVLNLSYRLGYRRTFGLNTNVASLLHIDYRSAFRLLNYLVAILKDIELLIAILKMPHGNTKSYVFVLPCRYTHLTWTER